MFLYRDKELDLLENDFLKPSSSLNFIFGRRKVGKTALINYFSKNKNTLYLSSFETMPLILINNFKKTIDHFFNIENKEELTSFDSLFKYISLQKIESKIVIVLEDINNLLKIDKDFLTTFYKSWNKYLKYTNIQFVISSSFYSSKKEDLAVIKRADNIFKLRSLNFNIIKTILPDINKDDLMYVYSAFGTNPQYLALYDTKKDFILNIKDNFLLANSLIFNEGTNIIKNDLSDVVTYSSILYAIAMGNKKIGDIANFLSLKSSYLTRYLQKLVDLMILEKIVPINENPIKSKFGRYEIEDNFLKFWFCYVYPNFSFINKNDYYSVIKVIRIDFSKRLVQYAYKKHVEDLIQSEPEKFFGFIPTKIGSWWNNKEVEIDFVAYNSKFITFVDCKWRKNNTNNEHYNFLLKKAKNFETTLEKKYIIFSKNANNK